MKKEIIDQSHKASQALGTILSYSRLNEMGQEAMQNDFDNSVMILKNFIISVMSEAE